MHVPVVLIRVMRMPVVQRLVNMLVRMRLRARIFRVVLMPMMLIVNVAMIVDQAGVRMFVFVPFAQVQPKSSRHQGTCTYQLNRHRLIEEQHGDQCAGKRCD
jgi:hypothetical protein